jgi:glutathione synthase/RimK-type ligase-like ATP-grasp enzyme
MSLGWREIAITIPHRRTSSQAHLAIALVTYRGLPGLSADDQLLLAPLAGRGIRAVAAAWDDPVVAWASFDALVIRSTWNYHRFFDDFRTWLDRIETLGVPTWNPPAILRWNASKTYLRDLAAAGVDVVPTRWVERGTVATLRDVLADTRWSDAVVKPAISASAHDTWRLAAARVTTEDESRFRRLSAAHGVMVQPFLAEVPRDGEWSFVFLGGTYSHAVLKRPRAGDFRVQPEHGGSVEARTPKPHLVAAAREVVARVPAPWLYARVDGVEIGGRFVLVELEMLEPSLLLESDPRAPATFADAIAGMVHKRA